MATVSIVEVDQVDECQIRVALNRETVDAYADAYRDPIGDGMPPLAVYRVGKRLVLVDGYHRLAAAALAERPRVKVEVIGTGTVEDARRAALRFNQRHGLPLTKADRLRMMGLALQLPEYREASSGVLAELLGVSTPTAIALRVEAEGPPPEPLPPKLTAEERDLESAKNGSFGLKSTRKNEPSKQNQVLRSPTVKTLQSGVQVCEITSAPASATVRHKGKDGRWRAATGAKPRVGLPGRDVLLEAEQRVRRIADELGVEARRMNKTNPMVGELLVSAVRAIRVAVAGIAMNTPNQCPRCKGKGECASCNNHGWVPGSMLETLRRNGA